MLQSKDCKLAQCCCQATVQSATAAVQAIRADDACRQWLMHAYRLKHAYRLVHAYRLMMHAYRLTHAYKLVHAYRLMMHAYRLMMHAYRMMHAYMVDASAMSSQTEGTSSMHQNASGIDP